MTRVVAAAALATLVLGAHASDLRAAQARTQAAPERPAATSDALKAIVTSYLEIHAQLAADKIDAIKKPSAAIAARSTEMGKDGPALMKAAKAMEIVPDVPKAREAFGVLSDAVIAAARAEGFKDLGDVKVAFCPMVNKSWLQKGTEIRNPYYGPRMSSCGEIKPQ